MGAADLWTTAGRCLAIEQIRPAQAPFDRVGRLCIACEFTVGNRPSYPQIGRAFGSSQVVHTELSTTVDIADRRIASDPAAGSTSDPPANQGRSTRIDPGRLTRGCCSGLPRCRALGAHSHSGRRSEPRGSRGFAGVACWRVAVFERGLVLASLGRAGVLVLGSVSLAWVARELGRLGPRASASDTRGRVRGPARRSG